MKTFLLLLALATAFTVTAQKSKPPVIYKKAISISPLALADLDHTLLLTGEYRFNNKLALVTDVGYIFASDYIGDVKTTWGFNIRPSLRMYYGKRNKGYLQAQAFYKMATYTLHDWVGKDCVNGVPTYEQQMDFDYRKKVAGFNVIAGGILPLSKSGKWLIDLYGGLGFRYKTHEMVGEGNDCYNLNSGSFLDLYNDEMTTLSVPMGVRLTYVLQ
jgi:hypothetical protein